LITDLKEYGIAHIGFVVRNREETVAKISTLFGVDQWTVYEFQPTRAWSYGREVKNYKLKIAMGAMKDGTCKVEVIEPFTGDGVHRDFVRAGNSGLHHFAFSVEDYPYWRDRFQQSGASIVFESETEDNVLGYRRCFYAEDSYLGAVYEIMEKPYFRDKK
jgi:catechol 2,3-dioxygenase-like lactoylglutathione lyase family enzyme